MAVSSPEYCVWEITLACNLACRHCGSSAGAARRDELDTDRALRLVDELADLGLKELTLSGGELLLRPDLPLLLARSRQRGMAVLVISNGLSLTPEAARMLADAGVGSVSISVDGVPSTHDFLRPVRPGWSGPLSDPRVPMTSHAQIVAAFRNVKAVGLPLAAITQVSRHNLEELPAIRDLLVQEGVGWWQVQITHAMGRVGGAVQPIAPADVPRLYRFIRRTQDEGRITCLAADDVGWFARDEHLLRGRPGKGDRFWTGCQAGLKVLGINSRGDVKGCLSMPDDLMEGNVRERPLREIWEDPALFAYNRAFRAQDLKGACGDCAFGRLCRAGCHSLAWTATGQLWENPYCIRGLTPP